MNHLNSSMEEIRQMRLAYFSRTQLHEPTPTAPEGKLSEQKYEIDSLQHYQGNNRSSSNFDLSAQQVRAHSLISDGAWKNDILSRRISEADNSESFWFKSVSVQEIRRFDSLEHFPHARSPSSDEEDSVDLNYNVLGLATHRAGSSVRRGWAYNKGGGVHRQEQMKMAEELFSPQTLEEMRRAEELFSPQTLEEMKAALGEEGLRQVLMKIADNLQKLKKGEAVSQDRALTEMRERVQNSRLPRPPSGPNTEVNSRLYLRQSSQTFRGGNPQSSHGMPIPVTKNLSLKIDEPEVDIPARPYSQVTVSSSQRNTISADDAYKQHFQPNSEQCDQNHYRHINSEHLYHHRQARQEHLSPSDNSSRFQINQFSFHGAFNKPAPAVLSNLQGVSHLQTWSGSSEIHFINSPFNPSSPLIPHPMFQSLYYPSSFNPNLPAESQMPARWTAPQVFSGEAQTAFDMHCYPLPNRQGVPELAFFPTPFHQSPTAPLAGFNQPLLPPLSPAPSRRDDVSHLVSEETQIASHTVASFSQQMHSSLAPGVSSPLPAMSFHHRSSLTNLTYRNGQRQGVSSASALASYNLQSESQHEIAMNFDIPEAKISQRPCSADDSQRQMAANLFQRPSSANVPSRNGPNPSTEFAESGLPRAVLAQCSVMKPGVPRDAISEINSRLVSLTPGCPEAPYLTPAPYLMPAKTEEPAPQAGAASASSESDSPRLLCAKFHRLPHEEAHTDQLHVLAKSAYDKFQEMTPRVAEGVMSLWQCLPDELWIFIFNFLSHFDLISLMQASRYFNRLANDETLWRYITVKPRYALTDTALAIIASHRPLSLAMVKCQGHSLSLDGLRDFFRETQGRLQELNICGCSQGSLVGSVLLVTAGEYCQHLTHLDASFCQLNDEAFLAITNCAVRLESVCVNGFQSMSDVCFLALLRKHGKSLRTLELYACFSLSAFAFHSIGEFCTNLRRLCLGSCSKLTDSVMSSLSTHLNQIQELDLRGCKNLWDDCIRKIVRNCPCIYTLILANCNQISDAALTEIATYLKPTLRVLDVCGCNRISDHGLANLARNCSQLISLDISSTSCTIISVQQLTNSACSKVLESVRLSFLSRLTEVCLLNLIQHCPRLRSIHVFGCSSLRSLANLQKANPNLSVEADIKESTLS